MKISRTLTLVIAGGLLLSGSNRLNAQGTIVFHQPSQLISVLYSQTPAFYDLDVDFDGTPDYRFNLSDGSGVTVQPTGDNRQVAFLPSPPDLASSLAPLPNGYSIGPSLGGGFSWVGLDSPNLAGTSLISAVSGSDHTGLFYGQTAFMGIEFRIGADTHYGWVLLQSPLDSAGANILGWAYDSNPNTAILAVPEPSAYSLLALAGVGCWLARRTRPPVSVRR
jgi:hypothetical protein